MEWILIDEVFTRIPPVFTWKMYFINSALNLESNLEMYKNNCIIVSKLPLY